MRRVIAMILSGMLLVTGLLGCGRPNNDKLVSQKPTQAVATQESQMDEVNVEDEVMAEPETEDSQLGLGNNQDPNTIIVFGGPYDIKNILDTYKELHPDFPYEFNYKTYGPNQQDPEGDEFELIKGNASYAPDLFLINSVNMPRFTANNNIEYFCPYEELGLDIISLVKNAEIEEYSLRYGTRQDGKLYGLAYYNSAGVFYYRRSIAKAVWGTDNSTEIQKKIGGSWDNFLLAAEDLKRMGYAIVSGYDDLWEQFADSSEKSWLVNGRLYIDPKREAFMDFAKTMRANGYDSKTKQWTDSWINNMKSDGKVLGYFGPWWFGPFTLEPNSGGYKVGNGTYGDWAVCKPTVNFYEPDYFLLVNDRSNKKKAIAEIINWMYFDTSETGLQSILANDKMTPCSSARVLKQADGTDDFLAGQDPYKLYADLSKEGSMENVSKYDESFGDFWLEQVEYYVNGKKSKEQAIADFKKEVKDYCEGEIPVE